MDNNSITFSLREIANWTDKCSNIKIPALQRGLVWKPRQVELLWDSLLRGFPIGSFLLSETDNNQYYLLDGQQRYNAISLGFNTVSNAKSVVWIDLKPKKQKMATNAGYMDIIDRIIPVTLEDIKKAKEQE